ncbi:ABC transporter substrate-binding protein [Trueperella bialowiezensis]|uniref:Glutamine-binding periplasmic protein n=1 Tax=Trueperella bialowiezensis TaxID=312285 RepID=A0A448PCZ7_9ACTO|nr:ABC transporter substrate-binding protein [Trueperella bialowiezensis]VEI12817.1 Glutamine-binding periplasmic protein precursor [Trueperella bialowiezensis]
MKRIAAAITAATLALALAACSDSDSGSGNTGSEAPQEGYLATDLSGVKKVDEIAAMVPESVAADGKLTVGTNIFFAPAEFYAPDGVTPQGYDIDMGKAIAQVLGLEYEVQQAEFASIIPGIGTRYEIGIANFTINAERQETVNMLQYFEAGSAWAVPQGNPKGFDPADVCGKVIGVQSGTYQDEVLAEMNTTTCASNPIQVQQLSEQSAVTMRVASGQIDAMYTDSPVADYAASITDGKVERVGEVEDSAGFGVVVAKDDAELTAAIEAAMNHLMEEGHMADIFATWGITEGVSTKVAVNPAS